MHGQLSAIVGLAGALALALSLGRGAALGSEGQAPNPRIAQAPDAPVIGTAFTYQGALRRNGAPVNGVCAMTFALYDDSGGGAQQGGDVTTPVTVTAGLFTVALDFGPGIITGQPAWLETRVECPWDGAPITLSPRTELTPAPYAIYASTSRTTGQLQGVDVSAAAPANGQVLKYVGGQWSPATDLAGVGTITSVNAGTGLAGGGASGVVTLSVATGYRLPQACAGGQLAKWNGSAWICAADDMGAFWALAGNTGTVTGTSFLGTIDDVPLELRANNLGGLRIARAGNDGGGAPALAIVAGLSGTVAISSYNSSIGGGVRNAITGTSWSSAIGGGQDHRIANSDRSVIAGGTTNVIENGSGGSAIGGGDSNRLGGGSYRSVVAGGFNNVIRSNSPNSAIGGGFDNVITGTSYSSLIGAGEGNRIDNASSRGVIAGGMSNIISGTNYGVVAGGRVNVIRSNSTDAAIGGGNGNGIDENSIGAAIGGGSGNRIEGVSFYSVIGGGGANRIDNSSYESAIGGGLGNVIDNISDHSAIGGGESNRIDSSSDYSAIGGGASNIITSAQYAAIPGGHFNRVEGDYGLAAGRRAIALHNGAFVWADATGANITSTVANQFVVRASGGVTMYTDSAATIGARLAPGSGSWTSVSDRNLKANISPVSPAAILAKVAELPVSSWNYVSQDARVRHIGPMAQDFYDAFGAGEGDTGISVVDADGVALAAIQGLKAENDALKARLEAIESKLDRPARPAAGTAESLGWIALGACAAIGALGAAYAVKRGLKQPSTRAR